MDTQSMLTRRELLRDLGLATAALGLTPILSARGGAEAAWPGATHGHWGEPGRGARVRPACG